MVYVFFIFTILLIIITKVEFKIINIVDDTDVYVKIGLLKIHIDYDMFIDSLNKIYKNPNFSYNEIKKGLGYYNIIKNIINNSNVNIEKINVVKKSNTFNIVNIYFNTIYYSAGNFIKNFLLINTKKQNEISFIIIPSNNNDIDIDVSFSFSLMLFIKSCLFNIKNIIKIKKEMV